MRPPDKGAVRKQQKTRGYGAQRSCVRNMGIQLPETNPNVWTPDRIWQGYECALSCPTDKELAVALQISDERLRQWKGEQPAFYRAILAARARSGDVRAGAMALSQHISNSLPDDLRELWAGLQDENAPNNPAKMAIATKGDYDRQRLLVHALSSTQFDLNRCMRLLNISKATLDRWAKDDPRFVRLWEEMVHAKKNFIESALMDLIGEGNTRAILFANERLNKDRGYGQTVTVEGTINHKVAVLDLSKLALDVDTKMKILDAAKNAGIIDQDGLIEGDPLRPVVEA